MLPSWWVTVLFTSHHVKVCTSLINHTRTNCIKVPLRTGCWDCAGMNRKYDFLDSYTMMMWAVSTCFFTEISNAQDWVGAVLNWSKTSCSVSGVDAFEGGLMIGWWSKPTNQLHLWHNNRSTQQWAGDNLIQEIWNQDISLGSKLRPILTKECPLKTALHICGYLQFFLGSQRPSNLSNDDAEVMRGCNAANNLHGMTKAWPSLKRLIGALSALVKESPPSWTLGSGP